MMIGMPDSARISLQTSKPDNPGSIRSSSTRSGCTSRNASSALEPSRTTAVSKPSPRSTMVSISARAGSSSTTNTRALMPSMVTSPAGERGLHRAGYGARGRRDQAGSGRSGRPLPLAVGPWTGEPAAISQPRAVRQTRRPEFLGAAGPDPAAAADGRRGPRRRRHRRAPSPRAARRGRHAGRAAVHGRHARPAGRHRRAADLRGRRLADRPARRCLDVATRRDPARRPWSGCWCRPSAGRWWPASRPPTRVLRRSAGTAGAPSPNDCAAAGRVLLGTAAIVGTLVAVGLMVLVVPGVIAYLIWVFAGPAVVMERASVSPVAAPQRAAHQGPPRPHPRHHRGDHDLRRGGQRRRHHPGRRAGRPVRRGDRAGRHPAASASSSAGSPAPGPARRWRCCTSTSGSAPSTSITPCGPPPLADLGPDQPANSAGILSAPSGAGRQHRPRRQVVLLGQ